jgi:hypothetical protein
MCTESGLRSFCFGNGSLTNLAEGGPKIEWLRQSVTKVISDLGEDVDECDHEEMFLRALVTKLVDRIATILSFNESFAEMPEYAGSLPPLSLFAEGVYNSEEELERCQRIYVNGLGNFFSAVIVVC